MVETDFEMMERDHAANAVAQELLGMNKHQQVTLQSQHQIDNNSNNDRLVSPQTKWILREQQ